MPILFSAVANESKIAAKYASCDGNFSEIAEEVIHKIPSKNEKMTYSHGHYLLHYIADCPYFYFCITDKTCQRSRAFLYLNELKRRFTPSQGADFCMVLADEMYRYNEDYSTIVIRKGELDELNTIGVGDSESLLGEKILFVNNPEELRYTVTVRQVGESPQKPILKSTAQEILESHPEAKEKETESREILENSSKMESEESSEISEKPKFLYYVIITVILVLMWLTLSTMGPISLVAVACICIVSIAKIPKSKEC